MSEGKLKIDHVNGKVEVYLVDKHEQGAKVLSGKLVIGTMTEYDSLSEEDLRKRLPPLGKVLDVGGDKKKVAKKKK